MRLELKIVGLLAGHAEKKFTINEIAKSLGEHYSLVHRTVNRLAEDNVVVKTKVGKSHLCMLNLENEKTSVLMELNEISKRENFYSEKKELKLILGDFVKSIESKDIATIVLFGSYAKGTETEGSDIDILLIGRGDAGVDRITKEMYAKYGKEISPVVMKWEDFKKQRDKPVIKELTKNHYVLHGVKNFVELVFGK